MGWAIFVPSGEGLPLGVDFLTICHYFRVGDFLALRNGDLTALDVEHTDVTLIKGNVEDVSKPLIGFISGDKTTLPYHVKPLVRFFLQGTQSGVRRSSKGNGGAFMTTHIGVTLGVILTHPHTTPVFHARSIRPVRHARYKPASQLLSHLRN